MIVLFAFGANLAIAASKFFAAWVTGSSSILSEGIHSLVDTSDQLLLLWGRKRSRRPPDAEHPYGYGMELYFWSLIIAILLFAMGGGMSIYEGITHMLHPKPLEHPVWNYAVLAFAFLSEGLSFRVALKEFSANRRGRGFWKAFHQSKNPEVFVILAEDSAALLGLIVAYSGIYLGHRLAMPILDGIGSLVIGVILGGVSVLLAFESRALLLGESAGPEVVEGIREIVSRERGIRCIGPLLTMHFGPDQVLLNMKIEFPPQSTAGELVETLGRLESEVRLRFPIIKRIFIEAGSLSCGGGLPVEAAPYGVA
ncbi:MAG: cation diffusion facilitator family transporter [Fibrobacteres bacterium]|nr:cation diffusion facilitator family transporter [Fibrobacterota bacterium]